MMLHEERPTGAATAESSNCTTGSRSTGVYQHAAFYLDVSGLSPQTSSSLRPVLNMQSSPSKDPGNFRGSAATSDGS
jgi:hypothetical protein